MKVELECTDTGSKTAHIKQGPPAPGAPPLPDIKKIVYYAVFGTTGTPNQKIFSSFSIEQFTPLPVQYKAGNKYNIEVSGGIAVVSSLPPGPRKPGGVA